jgi:hypothetical protein
MRFLAYVPRGERFGSRLMAVRSFKALLAAGLLCGAGILAFAPPAVATFAPFPKYDSHKWRSKHDYDRDRESYLHDCCKAYKPISKGHGHQDDECERYQQHKKFGGLWWWWLSSW